MKSILSVTLLVSTLSLAGCDAPESSECVQSDAHLAIYSEQADDLQFRGDPYASYISKWDSQPIGTKAFMAAVEVCSGVQEPVWLLTLSGYTPMQSTHDERVVGLGGSAIVGSPWFDCMVAVWEANGGIEF